MTQPAKHTSTGEVMAHFNLSDEEWDGLPSFVRQKLATVYCQHAAAPAMYEALTHALSVCEAEAELRGENDIDDYLGGAAGPVARMIRAALAQADGKQ